jgi:dipeptidase
MCDTISVRVGTPEAPRLLFGKNSDRQRNEAQAVERIAGERFAPDSDLSCTYLTIPQVAETADVLICRPFWGWGAEMGANVHGVVIANEGLHARSPAPIEQALTGMDLVRLGLERARDADEAVAVITGLLARYGQGGDCGHLIPSFYNNGFLVADHSRAFVIETVGREWMVEAAPALRTMSNGYSIARPSATSAGLDGLIANSGWEEESGSEVDTRNYAAMIGNPDREHIGHAGRRRARSAALLDGGDGPLGIDRVFRMLRDHGATDGFARNWRGQGGDAVTLCMHAGAEPRIGQTVGSMASDLQSEGGLHWVTATAAPCLSIFKPAFADLPLPLVEPDPRGEFDEATLWWRHERAHRAALADLPGTIAAVAAERDALEARFVVDMAEVRHGPAAARAQALAECWTAAEAWEADLASAVGGALPSPADPDDYAAIWTEHSRIAEITPSLGIA